MKILEFLFQKQIDKIVEERLLNYDLSFPEEKLRTIDDLIREVKKLLPEERLYFQIKALRPPEAKPQTEMQEILALRSILEAEAFLTYLENRKYNLLTAHIQEPTPEGRLEIKGRYLELGELWEGIKTSKEKSEEKAVEEALNNIEEQS